MKTKLLPLLSTALIGLSAQAQSILYSNDFTTSPDASISGSTTFSHSSDGNNWTITTAGHDEWDLFELTFPSPLNFSIAGHKPVVTLTASANQTVAFGIYLVDDQGHNTDNPVNISGWPNYFNIISNAAPAVYSYDFTGQFYDNYGNTGMPYGAVDSTKIVSLRFRINPGWSSNPYTYHAGLPDAATYKVPLNGTIKVDMLQVGDITSAVAKITANNTFSLYPNPSNGLVTLKLNNPNSYAITVSVSNVLGQEIYSARTNESNLTFDLSGKEKGLYYVSIRSNQGVSTTRLFLN